MLVKLPCPALRAGSAPVARMRLVGAGERQIVGRDTADTLRRGRTAARWQKEPGGPGLSISAEELPQNLSADDLGKKRRHGVAKLADLLALDDAAFRKLFSGSPVKRIGRDRFIRNCLYAAGNSGAADLIGPVKVLFNDPEPSVAEAARWALAELAN